MKKRKKNNSTKVAVTSAIVVTVLVGATVFSLYSLTETKNEGLYLSAYAAEGDTNSTGKLLSRMSEGEPCSVVDKSLWIADSANVPEISASVETTNTEKTDNTAKVTVPEIKTVEEIVGEFEELQEFSASEGLNLLMVDMADQKVDGPEYTTMSSENSEPVKEILQEEVSEPEEIVLGSDVLSYKPNFDSYLMHPDNSNSEDSLDETAAPVIEETVETPALEIITVQDAYVEPDYSEVEESDSSVNEETDYSTADDGGNNSESTGEWVFNYDTEEWEYVENGQSDYSYEDSDNQEDSYGDVEYTGEWIFNYDTEEWEYVEGNPSSDTSYEDSDTTTDTAEDVSNEEDSDYEWVYNYDTEEWEYVEASPSYDYEDTYEEETPDDYTEDSAFDGEWVYDYDTEEWIYIEADTDNDDSYDYEEDNDYDYEEDSYVENYSPLGQQIVNYAMGFVGVTPYVWAGRSLYSGTDCSGFVSLIYGEFGIYCSSASLSYNGSSFGYIISPSEARAGDIAVYGGGDHVAIYAGNGYVVHCSSPENGTVYWNMNYRSDFSWFLRVID